MMTETQIRKAIDALPPRDKYEKKVRIARAFAMNRGKVECQYWAFMDIEFGRLKYMVGKWREGGKLMLRNMLFSPMCGWTVAFPGDTCRSYNNGNIGEPITRWGWDRWDSSFNPNYYPLEDERDALKCVKSLEYFRPTGERHVMEEIAIYRKYPQSEALFKLGLGKLACQERIYHLSRELTKALCKFIFQNREAVKKNQNLSWIMCAYSSGETYEHFLDRKSVSKAMRDEYRDQQRISPSEYADYIAMARAQGYDLTDRKYRFPRDFRAMHDSLCAVRENAMMKSMDDDIARHSLAMSNLEVSVNGYSFRFPTSYVDFREQARELGNCLISNGYFKRYARGEACIVFVIFDGKRVGTAQLMESNGSIVQFTGNQKCGSWKPDENMANAFEEWRKSTFVPWAMKGAVKCVGAR